MKKLFTSIFLLAFALTTSFGQQAPDFSFTDINGETHTLSEALAEGKVILLDFFFVDCPPCNDWAPEIDAIAADFEGTNLEIWAMSDRDTDAYISGSIFNPTHSNHKVGGSEGGGAEAINTYAGSFNFLGFPTYSVICADGVITWDVWPLTTGVEEIRSLLTEECGITADPTGVSEITGVSLTNFFPNPVSTNLTVQFELTKNVAITTEVVNVMGQTVTSVASQNYASGLQTMNVDVANLSDGMYILKLNTNEGTITHEFVISNN